MMAWPERGPTLNRMKLTLFCPRSNARHQRCQGPSSSKRDGIETVQIGLGPSALTSCYSPSEGANMGSASVPSPVVFRSILCYAEHGSFVYRI